MLRSPLSEKSLSTHADVAKRKGAHRGYDLEHVFKEKSLSAELESVLQSTPLFDVKTQNLERSNSATAREGGNFFKMPGVNTVRLLLSLLSQVGTSQLEGVGRRS